MTTTSGVKLVEVVSSGVQVDLSSGEGEEDGEGDVEADGESDGELEGELEADGDNEGDIEGLLDGELDGEAEELGDLDGLLEGDVDDDGLKDGEGDGLQEADGDNEAEGLRDGEMDELGERLLDGDLEGDTEEEGLNEEEELLPSTAISTATPTEVDVSLVQDQSTVVSLLALNSTSLLYAVPVAVHSTISVNPEPGEIAVVVLFLICPKVALDALEKAARVTVKEE